jgi:hypothetical protein
MTSLAKFSMVVTVTGLVFASSGWAETGKTTTRAVPTGNASCPVAIEARHAGGLTAQVMVGKNQAVSSGATGQELQLTLTNATLGAVSAVRIKVRGWDHEGRSLPAIEAASKHANTIKTLAVTVDLGPRKTAETNVRVRGLSAVDSLELMAVKYADGSSWKTPTPGACSVVPDPTMLISER